MIPENNKTPKKNPLGPKFNIYWIYGLIALTLLSARFFQLAPELTTTTEQEFKQFMLIKGDVEKIDLIQNKEVDITSKYDSLSKNNISGDFKFIIIEKYLSFDNDLPFIQRIIMDLYYVIKKYSLSEARAFGLESSLLKVEKFPMIFNTSADCKNLKRIH